MSKTHIEQQPIAVVHDGVDWAACMRDAARFRALEKEMIKGEFVSLCHFMDSVASIQDTLAELADRLITEQAAP